MRRPSIACFSVDIDFRKIEEVVEEWSHQENAEVVAVEVFDHPESRYSDEHGCTIGPFVVGQPDDVDAFLARQEWGEDTAVQYSLAPMREE